MSTLIGPFFYNFVILETNLNRTKNIPSSIIIEKVKEIEENLWEPRLGLKGKIDVTAQFQIKENETGKRKVALV